MEAGKDKCCAGQALSSSAQGGQRAQQVFLQQSHYFYFQDATSPKSIQTCSTCFSWLKSYIRVDFVSEAAKSGNHRIHLGWKKPSRSPSPDLVELCLTQTKTRGVDQRQRGVSSPTRLWHLQHQQLGTHRSSPGIDPHSLPAWLSMGDSEHGEFLGCTLNLLCEWTLRGAALQGTPPCPCSGSKPCSHRNNHPTVCSSSLSSACRSSHSL